MKWPIRHTHPCLPVEKSPGDFAVTRSFYYHSGLDLYCSESSIIQTIEEGQIVKIERFTGKDADPPSPWWNETWAVMVEGKSGCIGYCELFPSSQLQEGSFVKEGETLGVIVPVLKRNKGNGTSMLHLEYYKHGQREFVTWLIGEEKPHNLLNPRILLNKVYEEALVWTGLTINCYPTTSIRV